MSCRGEALAANEAYATKFDVRDLQAPPTRQVVVVACMDARLRPEDALGLGLGEAHVIRNAGGRGTDDVVRSLIISSAVLGTRALAVVHHTDCGLLGATNEGLSVRVTEVTGEPAGIDFLPFDDAERTLAEDVRVIERDPRLPFEEVTGLLYDVRTGRVREVTSG